MSMLGLESLNTRTPNKAQKYATMFALAELSTASEISDEALSIANSAAAGIDSICNIYDVAVVCKKFNGVTKSVEALIGKELVSLEYKDQRTLWEKIKEFFVRLWHSIQDWFAKFNFAIDRCLKALNAINMSDWKDPDFEKVKDVKLLPFTLFMKYPEMVKEAINDKGELATTSPQKLSESAKDLRDGLKALKDSAKGSDTIQLKSVDDVKTQRDMYIKKLNEIKSDKQGIVLLFEKTAQRIKGGRDFGANGEDSEEKNVGASIRALKDQRHALMTYVVYVGKLLVKDGWKLVNACKKIKEKKDKK